MVVSNVYVMLYVDRGVAEIVSKEVFKRSRLKCIDRGNYKFRLIASNVSARHKEIEYLISRFTTIYDLRDNNFVAQGVLDDITSVISVLITKFKDMLLDHLHVPSITSRIVNLVRVKVSDVFLRFLSSELTVYLAKCLMYITRPLAMSDLLPIMLEVYHLFVRFGDKRTLFNGQGLVEAGLLAASTMALPSSWIELVRRVSVFTSRKICDEVNVLDDIAGLIVTFFSDMVDMLCLSEELSNKLKNFVLSWPIGATARLVRQMSVTLREFAKDNKLISRDSFQLDVREIYDKIIELDHFFDACRRSPSMNKVYTDFLILYKSVLNHSSSSRVEPFCLCLEGPPEVNKTTILNTLEAALRTKYSVYCHRIKPSTEGKDFYDAYNNEDVFISDEFNNQGASQLRNYIPMISSAKMPLECSDNNLKCTKWFNSSIVLTTSNDVQNISIRENDGIGCKSALFRRIHIIDFSKIKTKFVPGLDNILLDGQVKFLRFDVIKNAYVNEIKDCVKPFFEGDCVDKLNLSNSPYMSQLIPWILQLIKAHHKRNLSIYGKNKRSVEELKEVMEKPFIMQGLSEVYMIGLNTKIWIEQMCSEMLAFIKELKDDFSQSSIMYVVFILGLVIGIYIIYTTMKGSDDKDTKFSAQTKYKGIVDQLKEPDNMSLFHSSVSRLASRNLRFSVIHNKNFIASAFVLLSGHYVISVAHNIEGEDGFISIYKDVLNNHVEIDNKRFCVVYRNLEEDVCILKMDDNLPTTYPTIAHFLKQSYSKEEEEYFISHNRAYRVRPSVYEGDDSIFYEIRSPVGTYNKEVLVDNCIFYDIEASGLCGNIIFSPLNGIRGMHVAGANGLGFSMRWSFEFKELLLSIINKDKMIVDLEPSKKIFKDFSGEKYLHDLKPHYSSKESSIVPSPLYNVLPISRFPANLSKYGPHTIKDVAKKSFVIQKHIPIDEIKFCERVMELIIPKFSKLEKDSDIIKGIVGLNKINKDSSNGYGMKSGKESYININDGMFVKEYKDELDLVKQDILDGNFDLTKWVAVEQLKDETRPLNKDPRTFRILTLTKLILDREYFSELVVKLKEDRWTNGIMIGINPYKEWLTLYNKLISFDNVFDGDVSKWDGCMNSQMQQVCVDVIVKAFEGNSMDRTIMEFLLRNVTENFILVNDDLYKTTHSMPSGCFLTAVFNSLVNIGYIACAYYRVNKLKNVEVNSMSFWKHVFPGVYGDDQIVGCSKDSNLDAIIMRDFFKSLGMDYTSATKDIISSPYGTINDVSFLKRKFRYDSDLLTIVCPLDTSTIYSSLSWVDSKKIMRDVLFDKINAFQREIFLWGRETYLQQCEVVFNMCEKEDIKFLKLDYSYLKNLYIFDREEFIVGLKTYDDY
jgi:hypothetical protein